MRVLLVLLIFIYQSNPHPDSKKRSVQKGQAQAEANNKQSEPNRLPAIGECNGCFSVQEPSAAPKQQNSYDAAQDTLYRWYLRATIAGVIFGLIGLRYIYKQFKETRKAAEAAHKSAEATDKSVTAIIESERAWVIAELGETQNFVPDPQVGYFWIVPRIRNRGNTIARIKKIRAVIRLNKDGEKLPQTPEYPVGQGADIEGIDYLLAPRARFPIRLIISSDELASVHRTERYLYVHGFIIYADFSGKERRTAFCYYYAVQHGFDPAPTAFYLELTAPPGYNEYT